MRHSFSIPSLLFLFASRALATIVVDQSCSTDDKGKIDIAVAEAQKVADAALKGLQTGKCSDSEAAYKGAYDPLFSAEDNSELAATFTRLGVLFTAQDYTVTIYCTTDHVKKETHTDVSIGEQWYDTVFVNHGNEGNGENVPAIIDQDAADRASGKKPGDGESFAVLGWAPDAPKKDFSDQAHIFIQNKAINPDAGGDFDTRSLADIVRDGFLPGKSVLDYIRGLTTTVLHELTHVAGGLIQTTSRGARITDGPNGLSIYGWIFCMAAQTGRSELPFKTKDLADCLTMFAQACYLQIKKDDNPPTCWNTGKVYPDTLKSILPDDPVPQKRSNVMEARARWYSRHSRSML